MAEFTPRKYQAELIRRVIDEPRVGLFLDMGLGKTVITLSAIRTLVFEELAVRRVLIVAPKTVAQGVWQDEADRWDHTRGIRIIEVLGSARKREQALRTPGAVYTVNYENFVWLCGYFGQALDRFFDMVVFDESSKMKSPASQRFRAARAAMAHVPRVLLLTGTPSPNGYEDLWSQVYLLDRGERLGPNITAYRDKYFRTELHDRYRDYTILPGAAEIISRKIADICVSLGAVDVLLDLPEITYIDKRVTLSEATYKAYKDFERRRVLEVAEGLGIHSSEDLKSLSPQIVAANAAALRAKLLQFANGAVYLGNDALGRPRDGYTVYHDEKVEFLLGIIDAAHGEPILLTYAYRHDLDRLTRVFEERGINARRYQSTKDRDDWNAGRIAVLLVHPASAGYGLNLQRGGSIVVWFGLTDNLEHYQQLNKRLHRSGQRNAVRCVHIVARGTEDEKVVANLSRKDKSQAALLDSLKAKFDEYL